MKHIIHVIKNEDGSAILVAVLILMAVTVLGMAAINTSSIESKISGNERVHKLAFYNSEGAYPAVIPPLDGIRKGNDPAGFPAAFPNLTFVGNPDDFWDEKVDEIDQVTDAAPDVIVTSLNNARVDVDQKEPEIAGESIINRAGYEGLGSGGASGWTMYYRVVTRGSSGNGEAISDIQVRIASVR